MARPRQKRKLKSGNYKPVRTTNNKSLRKVPTIRGPLAIREGWDNYKSLHANYAALGLARIAGPPVKGETAPVWPVAPTSSTQAFSTSQETSSSGTAAPGLPKGYGRIIRDAEGKVIRVEMAEQDQDDGDHAGPSVDPKTLNPFDIEDGDDWQGLDPEAPKNNLITALEERSQKFEKTPRAASMLETKWLVSLIVAHGDDIDAMHRDIKQNVWQRTPGELRRAIKKAGGIEHLRSLVRKARPA